MHDAFKTGDRVRWSKGTLPEYQNAEGTVTAILETTDDLPEFTLYEIEFEFGKRTLYRTQIEPA